MIIKTFFIFLVIMLFTPCSQASQKPHFGYVNVVETVMLHPMIKDFNASSRRFNLSAVEKNQQQARRDNIKRIKNEIKKINQEIKMLEDERRTHEAEYVKKLQQLVRNRKVAQETSDFSQEEYNERRRVIDDEFHLKIGSINREVTRMRQEIANLERESTFADHATYEDSRQVFSLILDDVYEAIDQVADYYEIPFVFNSSFEFQRSSSPVSISNPMPRFFSELDELLSFGEEGDLTMASEIKSWLDVRHNNLSAVVDSRLTNFVLKGGVNMTPAVVDYIYQKHNIGETQREFIQNYYKTISTQGN